MARGLGALALFGAVASVAFSGCSGTGTEGVGYLVSARALAELAAEPINSQPWDFAQNPGTLIQTENYRLYTTIRDPLYQRLLCKTLEAAHARAVAVNPRGKLKSQLECYVFASRSQWELYTKLHAGENAATYLKISSGGYCQRGVFAGYDIGRDRTLPVISHEAWHQYSWFAFKDHLPSWIEEGLATQNEGIEWEGATPQIRPELNYLRWFALRQAIRENRLWRVDELAGTHAGQVINLSQKHVDAYYAELWSLTLFLQHSPKYSKGLSAMLTEANAGTLSRTLDGSGLSKAEVDGFSEHWNAVAGPAILRKYFNADTYKLQREYEAWARDFAANWPPNPDANLPE